MLYLDAAAASDAGTTPKDAAQQRLLLSAWSPRRLMAARNAAPVPPPVPQAPRPPSILANPAIWAKAASAAKALMYKKFSFKNDCDDTAVWLALRWYDPDSEGWHEASWFTMQPGEKIGAWTVPTSKPWVQYYAHNVDYQVSSCRAGLQILISIHNFCTVNYCHQQMQGNKARVCGPADMAQLLID